MYQNNQTIYLRRLVVVDLDVFLNFTVAGFLHVNFPRVYPFRLNIVFVQIPIARFSLFLSTFLIHLHNFVDKICSASFIRRCFEQDIRPLFYNQKI